MQPLVVTSLRFLVMSVCNERYLLMSVKEDGNQHRQSSKYAQHYTSGDGYRQTFSSKHDKTFVAD